MTKHKGSVLFAGQAYYNAWYLSRALRKLGWKADVLNWNSSEAAQNFYHGEDIRFFYNSQEEIDKQISFYQSALKAYDIFHFSNTRCMTFGRVVSAWVTSHYPGFNEISLLKHLGKKITYSHNGCHDGVKLNTFSKLGTKEQPTCDICPWRTKPNVCSDELSVKWGEFRNSMADYQCILGGNKYDFNLDPHIHETPEFYCLDSAFWHPNISVPNKFSIDFPESTVKIYHAVGNYDSRTDSDGVNIKSSHIYIPLLKFLKATGYPVELIFAKDVRNRDVRFLQVQADIVVDMLTFGFFGANIREAMMLGKPCVCYLRPEWLESMRCEIPEYVDELPVVNATPQTIYEVLVDLIEHPEKRLAIGRKSREFALKWHSAEAGARRFDQIYTALLHNTEVPPRHCDSNAAMIRGYSESSSPGNRLCTTETEVDTYWNRWTVLTDKPPVFASPEESFEALRTRESSYPLFYELMELYGDHSNEVIVDYGCGPANDLIGFLQFSNAKKTIGIDISQKSIDIAHQRLQLHGFDKNRYELIKTFDSAKEIPLDDSSVDYIYSGGVIHHASHPDIILRELFRVLKPNAMAKIMVYNKFSIYFNLHLGYVRKFVTKEFTNLSTEEIFRITSDAGAPIAICYDPNDFSALCEDAGFTAEFLGGYFSFHAELGTLLKYGATALSDPRFESRHKEFVGSLSLDHRGFPLYKGKYAGLGGVYNIRKPQ